jgi:hypothetical protein
MPTIADPRVFPASPDAVQAALYARAASSLAESAGARASAIDDAMASELADRLRSGDGAYLAALLAMAPSPAIARYLWRRLIDAWRLASQPPQGTGIAAVLFALPIVIVAGAQARNGSGSGLAPGPLPAVLPDVDRIAAILREHGALGGCKTFALASALAGVDALAVSRLPSLLRWQVETLTADAAVRDVEPAPIALAVGQEGVHLRFLVGTALAAPQASVLAFDDASAWGIALARELARQLAAADVSVLALPRPPATPPAALQQGQAARRTVGAQLFASNAIRRLRTSIGEPSAVISAHRCPDAPGGGELRLSLSSAFDPHEAEAFRCPLLPTETVDDAVTMLLDLLHDCRVTDVRVFASVHADRDPGTGARLVFNSGALPEPEQVVE